MSESKPLKITNFPPDTDFLVRVPTGEPECPYFYISGHTDAIGQCDIGVEAEEEIKYLEMAQANNTLHVEFGRHPRKVNVMYTLDGGPALVYSPPKDLPETESWIDRDRCTLMVKIRRWMYPDKMPESGPTKIGAIFSIDYDIVKLAAEPIAAGQEYPIIEMVPELPNPDHRFVQRLINLAFKVGGDLTELQKFIKDVIEELSLNLETPDLYKMQDELYRRTGEQADTLPSAPGRIQDGRDMTPLYHMGRNLLEIPGDIIGILESAPRIAAEEGQPEGARLVQMTETLVNQIVNLLRRLC